MQTNFTEAQLQDPGVAASNDILRACVHCGFCTATCPTYQLLGDELDSPRGRIYLIKDMLESGRAADRETVTHVDRCLSCLACMTTCPSGVHYMHLVDHARAHIEKTYRRPLHDRALRAVLAKLIPNAKLFRAALGAARLAQPFAGLLPQGRLKAMLELAPRKLPAPSAMDAPQVFPAEGERKMRVALMTGCAQKTLAPQINEATIRLLTRHGVEVVVADGAGCCGALAHHMGKCGDSEAKASKNVRAWLTIDADVGLDAIIINASGCGTTVKDYGWMFRDTALAADAKKVAALACDVTEFLARLNLQMRAPRPLRVAYHAACSLQHGQKITKQPKDLLARAGFEVVEPREAHLCCGSAGTYNMLQPGLSSRLGARKADALGDTGADIVATGNIGCMTQLAPRLNTPILHIVEVLDWASGGKTPSNLPN